MLRADRLRGPKPFDGVGRWHPDVHDRDIRMVITGRLEQAHRVADLRYDVETRVHEQARDAFAHEHRIVGEDEPERHSQSTSARIAAPETSSLGMKPRQSPLARRRP